MTNRRNYIQEIEAKRARERLHSLSSMLRVQTLTRAFERVKDDAELRRYFPVALVAALEGFARDLIRHLIDKRGDALDSLLASSWAKEQKFDLTILGAVGGQKISVGELIAHLVPLKTVDSILSVLSATIGTDFAVCLATVHDRWKVEVEGQPKQPIVGDAPLLMRTLADMYRHRNVLAHETAADVTLSAEDIALQLIAVADFMHAAQQVVDNTIDPSAPLTQEAINTAAGVALALAERGLAASLAEARTRIDERLAQQMVHTHEAWLAYCAVQVGAEGTLFEGGSIRPMIEAQAREALIRARIADLGRLLEWSGDTPEE